MLLSDEDTSLISATKLVPKLSFSQVTVCIAAYGEKLKAYGEIYLMANIDILRFLVPKSIEFILIIMRKQKQTDRLTYTHRVTKSWCDCTPKMKLIIRH